MKVEDTDVICLLVHHCQTTNGSLYVTPKDGSYDIKQIRENLPPIQLEHLLLCHSFSGCDTVSSIYGFGKVNFLKKLCHNNAPEVVFETFNNLRVAKQEVSEAGVKLFQYLYK